MFVFSAAWIVGSDTLVEAAVPFEYQAVAQSVKGLAYVAVAAVLVYALTYHALRQTAAKKAQEVAMIEVQSMKTRALVTFGAWHDVRNIATAFSLNTQVLARSGLPPEEQAEIAQELGTLARRLVSLTENVSVKQLERRQQFDPARVAADLIQVLNRSRLLKAEARMRVAGPIPMLYGNLSRFEQMLMNLILNGDQATTGVAPVEVALASAPNEITIRVTDYGAGIAAADLERIWEPLYTTKSSGTGLGLLVVKDAVTAFNGRIAVTSHPGKGTCFSITLPMQPEPSSEFVPYATAAS